MFNALKTEFNLLYNIDKQVVQLILISLVGTNVCPRVSLMWEETLKPGKTQESKRAVSIPFHMYNHCRSQESNSGCSGENQVQYIQTTIHVI